jgi:predicted DNA-binding protein
VSELKLWSIEVPEDLYKALKIYSVTEHRRLHDIVNEAIELYLRDVNAGMDPVAGFPVFERSQKGYKDWLVRVDRDLYKDVRRLCLERDLYLYRVVPCILYHYLRSKKVEIPQFTVQERG